VVAGQQYNCDDLFSPCSAKIVKMMLAVWLQDNNITTMRRMGYWWTAGWGFATAWVFCFVANTDLSVIFAAVMLCAGCLSFTLGLVAAVTLPVECKFQQRFVMLNTGMVAAWTTAASCLSVLVAVSKNNENVNLRLVALILLGAVVVVVAIPMALWSGSVSYCLVFVWALTGAAVNKVNEKNENYLWGGVAVWALISLFNIARWAKREFFQKKELQFMG
jgi:hypothetical protein